MNAYLDARDKCLTSAYTHRSASAFYSPRLAPIGASPALTPDVLKSVRLEELVHLGGEVEFFLPIVDLHWIIWAIVQAAQSTIEFDYVGYALCRLDHFDSLIHQ
jgi:hypothetical protein